MKCWALLSSLMLASAVTHGAPVGDALQRPALQVRHPERAVLLSAARAGERIVAVGERGIVALSDDAGVTWRQAPCPVSVTLTTVRFADARNGVVVGHGGTVLTTADGGASWALRLDGRRLGVLAREAARTDAELKEAERLVADGPDKPFLDVLMFDTQRLLAVGAYGIAFHTTDGGKTWAPWMARLNNAKAMHWYVLRRHGSTVLLAGEQGLLLRSDDDGASFKPLASPYGGSWFAGEMTAHELLVAGLRGNVWRSADGGASWSQLKTPVPASITATAAAADGSLLLANQGGLVMHVRGNSLVPLAGSPLPPPSGLLSMGPRVLSVGLAGAVSMPGPPP
jgi:photosystem II stability/assembly factor-like uncharacterized protein